MAARVGIELSPSACRIVEIDGQPAWARRASQTRVRSFAVLPPSGLETRAKLESLRRRTAVVVVWNAPSEHRQVVVTGGSYESMRAEALAALATAGVQTQGVAADVVPVVGPPKRGVRQPVVVALASATELAAALQPVLDAGIRVRSVTTPAIALESLARQRRAFAVPGMIEAYVALEETESCIALVRDSVLVAAREVPWGYAENAAGIARRRDDVAARLADSVTKFVAAIGGDPRDIGQVCVCGALPELRSMTLPLMERMDVEVEPLDSLFGIDIAHVPEPADEFRERAAELRLAWAVAADWPPPLNLLRGQRRRASKTMLARTAVAAGIAAGLAVGWRVEKSEWWRSTAPKPQNRSATNAAPGGRAAPPSPAARATTPPTAAQSRPAIAPPAPDVGPKLPPVATPPPAVAQIKPAIAGPDVGPKLPPVATPPPAVAQSRPPVAPPAPDMGPKLPPVATPPPTVAQSRPPVAPPAPDMGPKLPPVATPPPAVAQSRPPVAPPAPDVGPKLPPAVTPPAMAQNRPAVVTPRQEPPRPVASPPRVTPVIPPSSTPAATAAPVPQRQAPLAVARIEPPSPRTAPPAAARTAPATPAPVPRRTEPPVQAEQPQARVEPPRVRTDPAPRPIPAPSRAEPSAARASSSPARPQPALQELALPFDAVLGTILYSPDRKLAIIDGRIVGPGDDVRGARVVDITATAVLLRDGQGRLRRLALAEGR